MILDELLLTRHLRDSRGSQEASKPCGTPHSAHRPVDLPALPMLSAVSSGPRRLFTSLYQWHVTPPAEFKYTPVPAAPDYTDHGPRNWAAFPGREGGSAELRPPPTEGDEFIPEADRPVDCFFLNPTTYGVFSGRHHYNAPLDDGPANWGIEMVLATQASCFNGLCRIYAPRYRQVTLAGVYYSPGAVENRLQAIEVAYNDIRRAFQHFIRQLCTGDRPFIVASHSQGTRMAARLLAECVEGTPLVERFIAGYLIGGGLPMTLFGSDFKTLHPCRGPLDSQCVIGWDCVPVDFAHRQRFHYSAASMQYWLVSQGKYVDVTGEPCLVTNPLTWRQPGGEEVEEAEHRGILVVQWSWLGGWSLRLRIRRLLAPLLLRESWKVETREGWDYVVVGDVNAHFPRRLRPPPFFKVKVFGGTYHAQDYTVFYHDIRDNANKRIRAFLDGREGSK